MEKVERNQAAAAVAEIDRRIELLLRFASFLADGRPARYLCPMCDGEGARWSPCFCDGSGVVGEAGRLEFLDWLETCVDRRTICERKGFEGKPVPIDAAPLTCDACTDCEFDVFTPDGKTRAESDEAVFCTNGMHRTSWGELVPLYGYDDDGRPVGYPVCERWKRVRRALRKARADE